MPITFRLEKGFDLTHQELDNNFKFFHKWRPTKLFKIGMYVSYNYALYECITNHTSTNFFEPIHWQKLTGTASSGGVGGIIYIWTNVTEQNNTTPTLGERGVRTDQNGRPVYEYDGTNWQIYTDAITGNQLYLDGNATTIEFNNPTYPSLTNVYSALSQALYKTLNVTLSTPTIIYENGTVINTVDLSWTIENGSQITEQRLYRKINATQTLITTVPIGTTTFQLTSESLDKTTDYIIEIDDEYGTHTSSITIIFIGKIYFGSALQPTTINSPFILALDNNILQPTPIFSNTLAVGSNEFIYIAIPNILDQINLKVNSIIGGIEQAANISFTNTHGYTEQYIVYKSEYNSLNVVTFDTVVI